MSAASRTRMARARRGLSGFTMVELLVAFVVIGTTLAALTQVQHGNARAGRAVAEATAQTWRDEAAISAYVYATTSAAPALIAEGYVVAWSESDVLSDVEAARLAGGGWALRVLTVRSSADGRLVWESEVLAPVQGGEP